MATEENLQNIGSQLAASDLSGKHYHLVTFGASGVALTGAGDPVGGVLQNKPLAGIPATVTINGRPKAVAGAAILKGAQVSSDANGKLRTAVSGDYILGQAAEAAGADGDIISVIMTRPGRLA